MREDDGSARSTTAAANGSNVSPTNVYKMIIRLAKMDDLPAIVDIYNQSIPSQQATGDTQPVSVEGRLAWFHEHHPDEHPIFVAEVDGHISGWCSLSAYRLGRA